MGQATDLTDLAAHNPTMEKLERIKRVSPNGVDYWHARQMLQILGYADWDGFTPVLRRARNACDGAGIAPPHHFRQTSVMMKVGKGGQRSVVDYQLTRAACYLVGALLQQTEHANGVAGAEEHLAVGDCRCDELVARTDMVVSVGGLVAVVELVRKVCGIEGMQHRGV